MAQPQPPHLLDESACWYGSAVTPARSLREEGRLASQCPPPQAVEQAPPPLCPAAAASGTRPAPTATRRLHATSRVGRPSRSGSRLPRPRGGWPPGDARHRTADRAQAACTKLPPAAGLRR
eukprot:scaffold4827_cov109-Isochrysis_galbana.AAC.16